MDGNTTILRFDVDSRVFSEIFYPSALGRGARGNLVNIKDELFMFAYNGWFPRKLELWKFKDDSWSRMHVFSQLVPLPFAITSSITYVNVDGSCLAIT